MDGKGEIEIETQNEIENETENEIENEQKKTRERKNERMGTLDAVSAYERWDIGRAGWRFRVSCVGSGGFGFVCW